MTPKQMSELIKKLRGEMSLRDFAAKCGVSHTTIDNLERGIDPRTGKPPQIKMATYQKIISACGLPSILSISEPAPDMDIDSFLNLFQSNAPFTISKTDAPEDPLWSKIMRLSAENRHKIDGYVTALLDEQEREEIAKSKNA